jgi:hypothetical protein
MTGDRTTGSAGENASGPGGEHRPNCAFGRSPAGARSGAGTYDQIVSMGVIAVGTARSAGRAAPMAA